MTFDIVKLGNVLYDVVFAISSFVSDIFFTTLEDLLERYVEQAESIPKLQAVISKLLELLTDNFPILTSATFFEFCCGSALLGVVLIEFAVWLIDIFK